jgi:hypothetical protein
MPSDALVELGNTDAGGDVGADRVDGWFVGERRWRSALVGCGIVVMLALAAFGSVMITVRPGWQVPAQVAWSECRDAVQASGRAEEDETMPDFSPVDVLVGPVVGRPGAWRVRSYLQGPDRRRSVMCVVISEDRRGVVDEVVIGD